MVEQVPKVADDQFLCEWRGKIDFDTIPDTTVDLPSHQSIS